MMLEEEAGWECVNPFTSGPTLQSVLIIRVRQIESECCDWVHLRASGRSLAHTEFRSETVGTDNLYMQESVQTNMCFKMRMRRFWEVPVIIYPAPCRHQKTNYSIGLCKNWKQCGWEMNDIKYELSVCAARHNWSILREAFTLVQHQCRKKNN